MADPSPTCLAALTPTGRGAVATIGVRGPRAIEIVGRRFASAAGKPLADCEIGRVVFGRFQVAAASAEEVVVGIVGLCEVELHCHGGLAAVEAVAAALVTEGAERLDWRRWAAGKERDAIAGEALVALAAARTERTAAILLDQYRGSLSSAAAQVGELLMRSDRASAARELAMLVDRASVGRHLTKPWRVVLAGRPNVGKSSLINALVGYQRSIVWNEPGTTRDVLTATTALDGWPVELADTAGLRAGGDAIEAAGVQRAQAQIAAADVVLLVCDWAQPWTVADDRLVDEIRTQVGSSRPMLIVDNKCDLPSADDGARPAGLTVSALTGEGLREIERRIAALLVPDAPEPGAAVPFTDRQIRLLREAQAACERKDLDRARASLERLARE